MVAVAACNPGGPTPTPTPVGGVTAPADLAVLPQPRLATLELGSTGPGFDGPGSFLSYDSNLSPDATMVAYASQLQRAGFRESGTVGAWTVFVNARLTVWVRVGSGGPPTSLLIRFEPTSEAGGDLPAPRIATSPPADQATSGGGQTGTTSPKATAKPAVMRRPDPPHAATTTIASQPSHAGATGTGSAPSSIGGGGVAAGGTPTGPGSGSGPPDGRAGGSRPGGDGLRR